MYLFFHYNDYKDFAVKTFLYSVYQCNPEFVPVCIFNSENKDIENWMTQAGVKIFYHQTIATPLINAHADQLIKKETHIGFKKKIIGFWGKVDVPYVCYQMNIASQFVMLTDMDVLFVKPYQYDVKPKGIAIGPEQDPTTLCSGGCYIFNLPVCIELFNEFMTFAKCNFEKYGVGDHIALTHFFLKKNLLDWLPLEYNFKPYWKTINNFVCWKPPYTLGYKYAKYEEERIIHFQGSSKPWINNQNFWAKKWEETKQNIPQTINGPLFRFENEIKPDFDLKTIRNVPINSVSPFKAIL